MREVTTFALALLKAASKSGDPRAIELAAILGKVEPCAGCNFIKNHCRCQSPGLGR